MRAFLGAALVVASLAGTLVHAHEGHDHEPSTPSMSIESAPRATAVSDSLELVAVLRRDKLVVYLDRFTTNEPVAGAAVEVDTPDGVLKAEPRDDVYELSVPWAQKPGSYDLLFTVTTPEGADVLTATLSVPSAAAAVPSPSLVSASAMPPIQSGGWGLIVGSAAGFALGVLAMVFLRGRKTTAFGLAALALIAAGLYASVAQAHDGESHEERPPAQSAAVASDIARRLPDGTVFAPKSMQRLLMLRTIQARVLDHARATELPGRIIPDPNASGYVQASVSGRLSPPEGGFPRLGRRVARGDVLAFVTPPLTAAETSDQRQRQGELDQQIKIVERRAERFERLLASGAASRVQLEEALLELQGLKDRRNALDRNRRQPEPLVAPVDGVVAAVNAVAGQIAETNAIVFQIVDPGRLWIEALSFEALPGVTSASARSSHGDKLDLEFIGSGLADRMQSVPVHFAIKGPDAALRIGQLVTVSVQSSQTAAGIAAPRASVLDGPNGQSIVYEHTQPERFEPRQVRVTPLDADTVLISAGLKSGARIVTQGAELLNQVR